MRELASFVRHATHRRRQAQRVRRDGLPRDGLLRDCREGTVWFASKEIETESPVTAVAAAAAEAEHDGALRSQWRLVCHAGSGRYSLVVESPSGVGVEVCLSETVME